MKKKGLIITASSIAAVLLLGVAVVPKGQNGNLVNVSVEDLSRVNLVNTVSADGTVKSKSVKNIYSTLSYPIKEIMVKTGDIVKSGDVLCILDSTELESQIALQEANLHNSNISSYYQATESEKNYLEAKFNYDNGLNSELNNSANALKTAEYDLNLLKKQYDNKQNNLSDENNTELINAKVAIKSKEIDKKVALNEYNEGLTKFADQKEIIAPIDTRLAAAKIELDSAEMALKDAQGKDSATVGAAAERVDNAQKNYDDIYDELKESITIPNVLRLRLQYDAAVDAYDDAKEHLDDISANANLSLEDLGKALENAQNTYDIAKSDYEAAKNTAKQQLDGYKVNMEKDKQLVSNQPQVVELVNLQAKLDACEVKATQDGVVTVITASQGVPASGILFEIQDNKNLLVDSSVKEIDISLVRDGLSVTIKSDATGTLETEGKISSISPLAIKGEQQNYFPVEVEISADNASLLIGTKARVKIIASQKDNVFAIGYDCVTTDTNGESCIYVAQAGENNTYTAKQIKVSTGLETDYQVEIISDELTEGMLVISKPENLTNGTAVAVSK